MRTTATSALVLAVSGESVTVDLGSGGSETLQRYRGVAVAAGDLAQITTVGRARFVSGVIGAGTAPAGDTDFGEAPPPDPSAVDSGSWLFKAIIPGTYRDGWREDTALLWQGQQAGGSPQYGAAWYGGAPTTLPGVLVRLSMALRRVEGDPAPVAPTMALYAEQMRPDGPPTVLAQAAGPPLLLGVSVDWSPPDEWAPLIGSGQAGGIGCYLSDTEPALALTAEGEGMALVCYWEDRTA